jgi:hypothetical protein
MTSAELAKEVFSIVEAKLFDRPSPTEFEMAYQSRVAIDKIRFAIKQLEPSTIDQAVVREASLQLADALDRLEGADRRFQQRFRSGHTRAVCASNNGRNGCAFEGR